MSQELRAQSATSIKAADDQIESQLRRKIIGRVDDAWRNKYLQYAAVAQHANNALYHAILEHIPIGQIVEHNCEICTEKL